ncbi:MAG: TolC family outer membrane protein [Burkholderiaceae bacterium]|nr:TolC family outer membrane protein [Burkholderiaceae bacterium]
MTLPTSASPKTIQASPLRQSLLAGAVALAFALPLAVHGQQPPPKLDDPAAGLRAAEKSAKRNDMTTLYRDALANDSQFAAARFQYQATLEREPQARAGLLPNVALTADAFQRRYDSFDPDFGNTFSDMRGGLSLSVPVYRPQNWEALEQAKLVVVQGESVLQQARQELLLRLANAYFNVLGARDQVIALEVSKEATLQQLAQAKREFEVGTKTIIDTNEAQARYDQIVAQLQVAVGTLLIRRNELAAIVGRDPELLAALDDNPKLSLPQPNDINTWVKSAEDANFGVRIARASNEIATREIQRAKDGHKPTVDLVANYNASKFNGTQTSDNNFRANSGNVGLQFTLPLYSGGITQSRVREALSLQERAAADLETARRTAANAARSSLTGVNFGLTQVQALESAERSARTQLESTRLGYQVGVRIQLDVLNATTQLVATQRDLKRARYDFLLSGLNLKASAGALTEDDLRAVNALLTQ